MVKKPESNKHLCICELFVRRKNESPYVCSITLVFLVIVLPPLIQLSKELYDRTLYF